MRRLLLAATAAALAAGASGVQVSAAAATSNRTTAALTPTVELFTTSAEVPREDLEAALPAFQTAVTRDLAAAWGTDARLFVGDPQHPQPADMTITVSDRQDCWGCGGYHWYTRKGQPYAKVFWIPEESWQLILTHELFEMLVDPQGNRLARSRSRTWLVEVADPCESGYYAYKIGGVDISDFILPAWYDSSSPGPFDFAGAFVRSGQIGRHGFASYLNERGSYNQVYG